MDASSNSDLAADELLRAQAELWNHIFAYTKSMSLRCAVELGIPDAVHRRGGAVTVPELVAELALPRSREPFLRRLMRLLAHGGIFDAAAGDGGVEFVAGDMFDHVPKADAVLLKWILHGWGDEECVRILRRCREAVPAREDGGRVIVVDLVVRSSSSLGDGARDTEMQLLWDVMMMGVVGSPERDEREFRKIFHDAGFSGYKILHVLGIRSVIEVYP
ncbi:hypothetical protein OsI_03768 [Oryza sativa Indica Group]|uniref:O-methyltransferase C-terminal domain-containing protein n=1 Tax=Oryza sativa subsp. indica TaxID=39946 RepID=A2WV55_ORYSI|nr:hypothetical protein OsI_03768 [Oryza sativa Indica Group]